MELGLGFVYGFRRRARLDGVFVCRHGNAKCSNTRRVSSVGMMLFTLRRLKKLQLTKFL